MTIRTPVARTVLRGALPVLLAGFLAVPASAIAQDDSSAPDSRWAPWLGCWDLRTENLTDGTVDPAVAAARHALPSTRSGPVRICVTPTESADTVRHQTIVNDESVLDETIVADGGDHAIEEGDCTGTRSAEWSATARQLFTRATLSCEGQPTRTISSLMMMVAGPTWVDVQSMEVSGRRSVRIRRYGVSPDQSFVDGHTGSAARTPSTIVRRLAIEEVTEASGKIEPEVLQAAIVEVGAKFPLDSERLIQLDRAGVPGPVVDVMVALTFPEKFIVESGASGYTTAWGGGGYDPWAISSPYAYLGMYSPFAYRYYGYYDPIFGPGYGWVPVDPGDADPDAGGRVVNGRGYTRVTPRRPVPVHTAGGVVDRSGRGGSNGANSGSTGGDGGGSATSGGYRSGSSGSGRTAKPRPPGGR